MNFLTIKNKAKKLTIAIAMACACVGTAQATEAFEPTLTQVLAKLSNTSTAEIDAALLEGKSYAQLAEHYGVSKQVLIDTTVATDTVIINAQLANGQISADKAREEIKMINKEVAFDVEQSLADTYGTVAKMLNMPIDLLMQRMDNGETLSQIAATRNVPVQAVIDEIVQQEQAQLNKQLEAGLISADEAELLSTQLPASTYLLFEVSTVDSYAIAAKALNMSENELDKKLDSGQSIREIATNAGVDVQNVISRINENETSILQKMVDLGLLSANDYVTELSVIKDTTIAMMDEKFTY